MADPEPGVATATTPRPISGFTSMGEALKQLQRYWQGVGMGEATEDAEPKVAACERCKDARFLRRNVPYGDPDFGKLVRCPACMPAVHEPSPAELEAAERDRLVARAGLTVFQRAKTFETFARTSGSGEALKAARAYAASPEGWLAIRGVPGCGKTHLGLAIANAGLDRMGEVRWWSAPELVEEARRLRGPNPDVEPEQYFELKRGLREAGLLVLDDFGGINPSDFAIRDFLAPILDARYRDRRPTVFTLVAPLEDIRARISDAIGRRMQDPDVCQVVFNAAEQWKAKSR
jgi:DNA replication protein DnaC